MDRLGVMLAWQVPAVDALRDGRLVRPFADAHASGLALWFVTPAALGDHGKVGAFRRWLKAELDSSQA